LKIRFIALNDETFFFFVFRSLLLFPR
jgi:hypothetical protein